MDDKEKQSKYRHAYHCQKNNAKNRGIEFKLTYQEWIDWWGEDIEKRGSHRNGLQMQRYGDEGAYELGNIKKGYPKDNRATWSKVNANKRSEKAKREHELFLDALMHAESKPAKDNYIEDEMFFDPSNNGCAVFTAFKIDRM